MNTLENTGTLQAEARTLYFSQLFRKPVHVSGGGKRLGRISDIVFALEEPTPRPVGVYLDHGWGKPDEFIPWERVVDLFQAGMVVKAPEQGEHYPPFQDQPGWILADKHLMGRTVLDIDDRKIEVVNDVLLQPVEGQWRLSAVDTSFNGFLRKWRLGWLEGLLDEDRVPWKFVQPLSIEDATKSDTLQLSIAHAQLHSLPKEDLADIFEELSGREQAALFEALEPDKAAETLTETEPRAQRQIIANLRKERAESILASLSTPQLADLLGVLPLEERRELMPLLPEVRRAKVLGLLSERAATAMDLMDQEFLTIAPAATLREAKARILASGLDCHGISYLFAVNPEGQVLGVMDARQLLLSGDSDTVEAHMLRPVVAAEVDDLREDLAALFAKYHFRMIPVVDAEDRIQGVVHHNDIVKPGAKA